MGLYIGGGEFIHSSSSGVRVSDLGDPYWRDRLAAARRIVGSVGSTGVGAAFAAHSNGAGYR